MPVSTGGFHQAIRVLVYLRTETKKILSCRTWDYHPLGSSFPARRANKRFFDFSDINVTSLPCNPALLAQDGLVFSAFARRYLRNACLFIFLLVLKCFTSQGMLICRVTAKDIVVHTMRFPHSDIFGSKVARHLPEAYRRHAASFIAFSSLGIHHTPLISH